MTFVKAALVTAFTVIATGIAVPRSEAAPLPTHIAAMKAAVLDKVKDVVQVQWGGWGYHGGWGGYPGGWGYRGWGPRGWGYGGWGLGPATGGVIIARSAYYDVYPYYGGGYAYDGCQPCGYGGYGYYARPRYYGYGW